MIITEKQYGEKDSSLGKSGQDGSKLYAAVSALQPANSNFLDVKMVQPLLDLIDRISVEAEFDVAKTYVAKFNSDEKTKSTTTKLLSEHCEASKAMPTVHLALKLRVTLVASTAVVLKLCVATPRCVVSIFQRRRGIFWFCAIKSRFYCVKRTLIVYSFFTFF